MLNDSKVMSQSLPLGMFLKAVRFKTEFLEVESQAASGYSCDFVFCDTQQINL